MDHSHLVHRQAIQNHLRKVNLKDLMLAFPIQNLNLFGVICQKIQKFPKKDSPVL